MANTLKDLSVPQLKRVLAIREKIDALQRELDRVVGGSAPARAAKPAAKRGNISAAGLARIRAAQRARWAKFRKSAARAKKPAAAPAGQ